VTTQSITSTIPPLTDLQVEREVTQFLYLEAEYLDETRYLDWYNTFLSSDLEYVVPTRTAARSSTTSATTGATPTAACWCE